MAPFYGWAAVGQGGTNPKIGPNGFIVITTAYDNTPSVAATIAGLRTRGHGVTLGASSPVKLAGFSGVEFDAQVTGKRHLFIPFSPPSNTARYYPDNYEALQGEVLRIVVLGVRGKTIVMFMDNAALPADQFPAFLTKADGILNTFAFPG